MMFIWQLALTLFAVGTIGSNARTQQVGARLRFPGPVKIRQLPLVLQRQDAAPYPPVGLRPDPPFELPPTQPDLTYGPPDPIYGPPDQTYGPPDPTYGPPQQTYGQPDPTYGPPADTYGPPGTNGPPEQTYGPPEQSSVSANDVSNNGLPQSASIIQADLLFPPTQLTLPAFQRFSVFRPFRPARLQKRPWRKPVRPAKIVVNAPLRLPSGVRSPYTQLTLPLPQRSTDFRPARLIIGGPFKPSKLVVNTVPANTHLAQLTPAIRKPIFSGGRIIGYSDRLQNW